MRKDFPDAIHWVGDLVTDAQGHGRIAVTYPDSLTTWRLTARAITEDTRAGSTVARTTTTKDLIVRVITPRFLTEGDEVVVPTMVHNYRPEDRNATVSIEATGLESVGAQPATTGALATGAERRDDWRYAAKVPGSATVDGDRKDRERCRRGRIADPDPSLWDSSRRRHERHRSSAPAKRPHR